MFWANFFCGVGTGIALRCCESLARKLFKEEEYVLKPLVVEIEDIGVTVEVSLIFDQFVGRVYACETGKSIVNEREAVFMMAEQLSNLEEKCSGDKKYAIAHLLEMLERFLSEEVDVVSLARSLRDGILNGALRV